MNALSMEMVVEEREESSFGCINVKSEMKNADRGTWCERTECDSWYRLVWRFGAKLRDLPAI